MSGETVRWTSARRASFAGIAAAVAAVTDTAYVALLSGQAGGLEGRAIFFSGYWGALSVLTLLAAGGTQLDIGSSKDLLIAAASGFLVSGLVASASVGLAFVVAAALAGLAARDGNSLGTRSAIFAVAAISVLLVGLGLT